MRDQFKNRDILILGSCTGKTAFLAKEAGARRVTAVEKKDIILESRKEAEDRSLDIEFWQIDIFSKEFQLFCPIYDHIYSEINLTEVKDVISYFTFLDTHSREGVSLRYMQMFPLGDTISLLKKETSFNSYKGGKTIICGKGGIETKVPAWKHLPTVFLPLKEISGPSLKKAEAMQDYPYLQKLKASITKIGLRGPLMVFKLPKRRKGCRYKGTEGGKRYIALRELGYKDVPCKIAPWGTGKRDIGKSLKQK